MVASLKRASKRRPFGLIIILKVKKVSLKIKLVVCTEIQQPRSLKNPLNCDKASKGTKVVFHTSNTPVNVTIAPIHINHSTHSEKKKMLTEISGLKHFPR